MLRLYEMLCVHLMSFMGRRVARNWYIGSSSRHKATRLMERRTKSNLMMDIASKVCKNVALV